ncbi:MAG: TlpA disulfide reductase family protein [Oscillospiraceae bacterium]
MNKQIKVILGAGAFLVLIIGASVLYSFLGDKYTPAPQSAVSQQPVLAVDFTVTNKDGQEVKLSDYSGKAMIVNFWASWCGPCKSEMKSFNDAYKKYGTDIEFMMVNMTDGNRETVDIANKYIVKQGYTFPVYFDTMEQNAAVTYGITSIPSTLFIDKEGKIVAGVTGAMDEKSLDEHIQKIN